MEKTLQDIAMRNNNLNILRLIGACLVLYGHSFAFLGLNGPVFLSWLPMGPLGVFIFFTISGYLITESWDHDPNLGRFLARRALRIFPALIVCVILTVFLLGPILTTHSYKEYFTDKHTWGYLRNTALYISYYLPGVFENNKYPYAVNGSLWTLPIEFFMYFIVAIAGVISRNRWFFAMLAFTFAIITFLWATKTTEMFVVYASDFRQVFICGTYFLVGAVFYKFNLQRYFSITLVTTALIAMICLEPYTNLLQILGWLLLPTVVLAFGFSYSPILNLLTRGGDYSYGIYIYAFPVQQTIVYYYPDIQLVPYILVCIFLSYFFASLSWHLIEKRALRFKPIKPLR